MKLIVWGTGKLYQKYREFLFQFNIIKLCDSDPDKQGNAVDGIEIIEPVSIEKYDYDYIIVMTYATEPICATLNKLGIPPNKILLHSQMYLLKRPQIYVNHLRREIPFNDWIMGKERCILLISHNYSYTGIPVALKNMANVLKKMGYSVLMAAMEGGTFTIELEIQKIDYVTDLAICYQTQFFIDMLTRLEAIVVGSFSLYRLVESLENIQIPVLWWIHETDERYYVGKDQLPASNIITFLAGGNRVKRVFLKHYKDIKIRKLQYCIPDFHKESDTNFLKREQDVCLAIAVIGTVDRRKAQDILLEAVIKMPLQYKERLKIVMIGRLNEADFSYAERIREQHRQICNLEWIPEITQEQLDKVYEDVDALVCPSRDDPMPIVVTQAMMHGKVCVISEEVGQTEFIRQRENGFVFSSEDIDELMRILMWLVDNKDKCAEIGEESRKIFDSEFSEEIMERRLRTILEVENNAKDI